MRITTVHRVFPSQVSAASQPGHVVLSLVNLKAWMANICFACTAAVKFEVYNAQGMGFVLVNGCNDLALSAEI